MLSCCHYYKSNLQHYGVVNMAVRDRVHVSASDDKLRSLEAEASYVDSVERIRLNRRLQPREDCRRHSRALCPALCAQRASSARHYFWSLTRPSLPSDHRHLRHIRWGDQLLRIVTSLTTSHRLRRVGQGKKRTGRIPTRTDDGQLPSAPVPNSYLLKIAIWSSCRERGRPAARRLSCHCPGRVHITVSNSLNNASP